ncbi:MAG: DUF5615 family PIN-like protein [Anaerolineales bacterium]|nr:DUF5615 family PIN-like protein [Anaerolineales bacterium]
MKPLDFPLLADENIHPEVIVYLRESGYDIVSVSERGLSGQSDDAILNIAFQDRRIILTHDSDFGRLAILQDLPFVGIIYLRPGHIQASFTIKTIEVIQKQALSVQEKFILVAERTGNSVKIRLRQR